MLTNTTYTYSIDLSDFFKKQYEKLGGEVVWGGDFIENMSDFSSILQPTKSFNPDVIFLPAYVRDSGFIIRQARQMGIKAIFLAGDGWGIDIFNYAKEAVNGSYLVDHWYPTVDTELSQNYVKDFFKKYGIMPEAGSALTFDAMNILTDAIERANSFDKLKIRDALATTKDFNGVTGKISFDKNGDPIKPAVIMKMENNKRVFVKSIAP